MEAFEVNKTIGAVLTASLVVFASKTMLDIAYKETSRKSRAGPCRLPRLWPNPRSPRPRSMLPRSSRCWRKPTPIAARTPSSACRATRRRKGGPNGQGPIFGASLDASRAARAGFPYSEAMKSKGGEWTWDALATYLHDPKTALPGNKMAFPGIRDDAELADVLAYLRKQSDTPAPLPQ